MDTGSSSVNTRRYIDVTTLGGNTWAKCQLCSSSSVLSQFRWMHVYTAAFMRKNKLRPFQVMQKSKDFTTLFGNIVKSIRVQQAVISIVE